MTVNARGSPAQVFAVGIARKDVVGHPALIVAALYAWLLGLAVAAGGAGSGMENVGIGDLCGDPYRCFDYCGTLE